MRYSIIAIIYNPNSTGPSERMAKRLRTNLLKKLPQQKIELIQTDHAGHGEEIAYDVAKKYKRPLIISSSGDGGYHDVVNGAMRAGREGAEPTTGLLPAGNANDHYRNVHSSSIIESIVNDNAQTIDILTLRSTVNGQRIRRYAHSYVGFGMTPNVGQSLNESKLNVFNQIWIVASALLSLKSVKLKINAKPHHYDSVIFSNVNSMSKVIRISEESRIDDGLFEVTIFRKRHKLRLIGLLLHASIIGIKNDQQVRKFSLRTFDKTLVQLDGEIVTLDQKSKVTVRIATKQLRCII